LRNIEIKVNLGLNSKMMHDEDTTAKLYFSFKDPAVGAILDSWALGMNPLQAVRRYKRTLSNAGEIS